MHAEATRADRLVHPARLKISAPTAGFMYQIGLFGAPVERRVDQEERR
jgi:hypothetical protein